MSRRTRCEKHQDTLYQYAEGCPKCKVAKLEDVIVSQERRLENFAGDMVHLKVRYPATRLFGPILLQMGFERCHHFFGKEDPKTIEIGDRSSHADPDRYFVPERLARGMEKAWEKIEKELLEITRYAADHLRSVVGHRLGDRMREVVNEEARGIVDAALAKVEERRKGK